MSSDLSSRGDRGVSNRLRVIDALWRFAPDVLMHRLGPFSLVGAAAAFNLWSLRAELAPVWRYEDGAIHISMIRWAVGRINSGHVPLDGSFPPLGLGFPLFHHYQSLPHVLTAYVAPLFGIERTYSLTIYLLLALWPVSVYAGARLLDWDRWTSGAAALISPLLVASATRVGYEHGAYTFGGPGLWTQLWAMVLLPIGLGLTWRAVSKGSSYASAAIVSALVIACHFLTGYLLLLSLGVWVLLRPSDLLARAKRAALIGSGTLLVSAWVIVPLIQDLGWTAVGPRRLNLADRIRPSWFLTGRMFDSGRPAVITALVLVGVCVCMFRVSRDERARALLGVAMLSLVLYFGKPLLNYLPFGSGLIARRYLIGVHLAGILMAGVAVSGVVRVVFGWIGRLAPNVGTASVALLIGLLGLALLSPAISERRQFDAKQAFFVRVERQREAREGADFAELVARTRGLGRIYVPSRGYRVAVLSPRSVLTNVGARLIGYSARVPSLAGRTQRHFDAADPAHYDLFDARHVILPRKKEPRVPASLLAAEGRFRLWKVRTSGYFKLIDTSGSLATNRSNFVRVMRDFLKSDGPAVGVHPVVTFGGRPNAPRSTLGSHARSTPRGTIELQDGFPDDGVFRAKVAVSRATVVMLKTSFHPRWTVIVDGRETRPYMVAPGFLAQTVGPGTHYVTFRYGAYSYYVWLFLLAVAVMIALVLVDRRGARRGGASSHLEASQSATSQTV